MSVFKRGDYVRLYAIACDLHGCTTNLRVRENAAVLMDLLVLVLGEKLHRPRGMRDPLVPPSEQSEIKK